MTELSKYWKPPSAKTQKALAMIGTPREDNPLPHTAYSAAKACGISLATIYKHTKRNKPA